MIKQFINIFPLYYDRGLGTAASVEELRWACHTKFFYLCGHLWTSRRRLLSAGPQSAVTLKSVYFTIILLYYYYRQIFISKYCIKLFPLQAIIVNRHISSHIASSNIMLRYVDRRVTTLQIVLLLLLLFDFSFICYIITYRLR